VEREQQRRIVEAIVLASPEPIAPARIAAVLPGCNPSQVRALIEELNAEYSEQRRAFEIWEVAGGYQLRSLPEFAVYLKQIQKTRPPPWRRSRSWPTASP
jgi:segregation and condensation protein B